MYITTTNFTNFTNISMQNDLKTMHHRCNELNDVICYKFGYCVQQ